MSEFIHDDFLLNTATARRLYHEFAADLPIIDFHNHLDAHELADDRRFDKNCVMILSRMGLVIRR